MAARAAEAGTISPAMIQDAEWITGLTLTEEQREAAARSVERGLSSIRALREVYVDYGVLPAVAFHPAPLEPPIANQRAGEVRLRESARRNCRPWMRTLPFCR